MPDRKVDIVIIVGLYHSMVNYLNTVPIDYSNATIVNLCNAIQRLTTREASTGNLSIKPVITRD